MKPWRRPREVWDGGTELTSQTVTLGSIARIVSGGTPSRTNPSYWNGNIPWVKTAQIQNGTITSGCVEEWITQEGLENSSARMIPKGTILMAMYGQGKTRGQVAILGIDATINQACAAIQLSPKADRDYVFQQLRFRYNAVRALSNTGSQENLSAELIREIAFPLPSVDVQSKIATQLAVWDAAILKTEQLIAAKERHYRHELSRLISRGQHPHSHVGNFSEEVSVRNRAGNEARVLSVTNSRGFVLPEDQFERRVASANLSNYKVVSQGQYAYNPSRINVGSIARLDTWDNGVLSPMYVVFKLHESKVDSDYFQHWLNSHEARQRIKNSAQGTVRETVSYSDLATLKIPLPNLDRQASIAQYLNALRSEIDLLARSNKALKTQKRGLMQKLLTGQWRLPMTTAPEPAPEQEPA